MFYKLRVLLIVPSYWNINRIPLGLIDFPTVPLGLCYIASVLEKESVQSTVFDMNAARFKNEKLEDKLKETNPDIVGITSMTSNFPSAVRVASVVKRWNPKCVVVMGGVHATFMHEEILETVPEVDFVVQYDGEFTMVDLVKTLSANDPLAEVKGICYRANGKTVANSLRERADLDKLPYPAHHLLKPSIEEYFGKTEPKTLPVITTRGCPFSCIYCSTRALNGCKYRTRSINNVIGELEY